MQSVGCDLVSAIADYQPTRPNHLQPGLQRANRLIAAGVIEPVIAHDKVSVKLSLPQRSLHSGGWLFHHRLNASAKKVLSRQALSQLLISRILFFLFLPTGVIHGGIDSDVDESESRWSRPSSASRSLGSTLDCNQSERQ
jgi:hypothetical protein